MKRLSLKTISLALPIIFSATLTPFIPVYALGDDPSLQSLLRCSNPSHEYRNSSGWLIESHYSCAFTENGSRWSFLKATKNNHVIAWRSEGGSGGGTYEILSVNTNDGSYILYEATIDYSTIPAFVDSMKIQNRNGLNDIQIRDLAIVFEWASDLYNFYGRGYYRLVEENPCTARRDNTQGSLYQRRNLNIQKFGIVVPIPSHYRSMAMQNGSIQILSPRDYQSLSCIARGGRVIGGGLDLNYLIEESSVNSMNEQLNTFRNSTSHITIDYQNEALDGKIVYIRSRGERFYFIGYSIQTGKVIRIIPSCDCQQNLEDFLFLLESVRPLYRG